MITTFFTQDGEYSVSKSGVFLNGQCLEEGDVYIQTLMLGYEAQLIVLTSEDTTVALKTKIVHAVLGRDEVYEGEPKPEKVKYMVKWLGEKQELNAVNMEHAEKLAKALFGNQRFRVQGVRQHVG